jgi:uncharacterized protein YqjF (DUF2071 family)
VWWRPADLADARRQPRTLGDAAHRPWPLPGAPWVMGQTWNDLLFAHYRVDQEALRAVLPPQVPLDTFDGSAWIGVTPFVVTGLRPRLVPPLPFTARFEEINVRTYATVDGKPGIWFLSLDAGNRLAVEAARRAYRLPYFRSRFEVARADGGVSYRSRRVHGGTAEARFAATYRSTGPASYATPGTFDHWCTERYCLYTLDGEQRLLRGDIHHPPWQLEPAAAEIEENTMARPYGIDLRGDPILHLARRQDVVFWLNRPAAERG